MNLIYKITNLINHKIYIGSTTISIAKRWSDHKYEAKNKGNQYFHKAMNKYGYDNFKIETICSVIKEVDLNEIEDYFINYYNTLDRNVGYNLVLSDRKPGTRKYMSEFMKNDWKNRYEERLASLQGSQDYKHTPLVAVCIYSGEITRFKRFMDALEAGFSTESIYGSLKRRAKQGQKKVWWYDEGQSDTWFKDESSKIIGGFKTARNKAIIGTHPTTGEETLFNNTFELAQHNIKYKEVARVLRGERQMAAGLYWKYA